MREREDRREEERLKVKKVCGGDNKLVPCTSGTQEKREKRQTQSLSMATR